MTRPGGARGGGGERGCEAQQRVMHRDAKLSTHRALTRLESVIPHVFALM